MVIQFILISILFSILASINGFAAEPILKIRGVNQSVSYTRKELLARKDVTILETSEDPTYPGKKMSYRVVPMYALFDKINIPASATIQFECLDGFSAPISKERLLSSSSDGSVAYLAIENAGKKWPVVKPGVDGNTAGPFYLVWKNPKKSKIGTEEWPFQLTGFVVKEPIETRFPNIVPQLKLANSKSVGNGFKIFLKNCFVCHTMNGDGESQKGPDLNIPMNPIEYLGETNLKKQIRNPQELRKWPQSKMNGFPKSAISNDELSDLIAYLKQMSTQKALK